MTNRILLLAFIVLFTFNCALQLINPKLTLDEFFNYVDFLAVAISPDGNSVVIDTDRSDWEQSIFRRDLWLYRDDGHGAGSLTQLTNSGDDSSRTGLRMANGSHSSPSAVCEREGCQ